MGRKSKLRLPPLHHGGESIGDRLARFALALGVSADEILGLKPTEAKTVKASFRMLERLEGI